MKKQILIFTGLFLLILISSCAKRSYSGYNNSWDNSESYRGAFEQEYKVTADAFGGVYQEVEERKVLFNAYLSLIVKIPDTANNQIIAIAKKYNGYVNQVGTYNTIIRVESDKLDKALEEIEALGKTDSKSISGQDVTDEYLDYEIRLENAQKARERYLELLEKAENVEAALKVEIELERLNQTIDLLTGKMNRIDHLVQYSTITISLKEKKKPGILGYIGMGLYYSVKWMFVRN